MSQALLTCWSQRRVEMAPLEPDQADAIAGVGVEADVAEDGDVGVGFGKVAHAERVVSYHICLPWLWTETLAASVYSMSIRCGGLKCDLPVRGPSGTCRII